jgi:dienelactone hydrolase
LTLASVNSDSVFLIRLGDRLPGRTEGARKIGINQIVFDSASDVLSVESDELLEQHARYALIVTDDVRNLDGDRIKAAKAFKRFRDKANASQGQSAAIQAYQQELRNAIEVAKTFGLRRKDIVAASVFTTQSTTAILEKIRAQLDAAAPAPADFRLGPGGALSVFPLNNVTGITFNRQTGTAPTFQSVLVPVLALVAVPGAVGQLAFGKYVSPDYETPEKIIPAVGTLSGTPAVQGTNEIFFTLFLPASPKPANGWPVAIFGHGFGDYNNNSPFAVAATMAAAGIATVAINVVGHGGGPLGTLTVNLSGANAVTVPAGGRGIDQDGNGTIDAIEGSSAALTQGIIANRDGLRQTVVDLMQLVRVIKQGVDIDADGNADLDAGRIYYFGQSFGGIYGTIFLAVEPNVRAGVPNVPGGAIVEVARLSPVFRPLVGFSLAFRQPALINVGGPTTIEFNENIPLRNQGPVVNNVAGASAIQEVLENTEWVSQSGNPVAYAVHLKKAPLAGVAAKSVILQFARGDQTVPNPTTTAMIRAGDLAANTTFFRNDLALAANSAVPKNPHAFLANLLVPSAVPFAIAGQRQIATFFATDGTVVIDPDENAPFFEVPISAPLPEDLGFIP